MMKPEIARRLLCLGLTSFLVLSFAACGGQTEEQNSVPTTTSNNVLPTETGLDFDLPENYEETAKQLASDFTIQWVLAYRSNDGEILQTALDDYYSMIRDPITGEPRNSIVSAWNNDHSSSSYWYVYESGPAVSSVLVKDNHVEGNAVYMTIDVSLTGTIQKYVKIDWDKPWGSPQNANDRATYEMYYDSDGWHFKTANLRLS